jgi:hypothetical protein
MFDKEINDILRIAGIQLEESVLDDKVFYCSTVSRLLEIAKTLGQCRFYYDVEHNMFVIGNMYTNTHIGLFSKAIDDGKYTELSKYNEDELGEYYSGNIESTELTGGILMKKSTNDLRNDIPDSTNTIFEYNEFYLTNGLWVKDKISHYLQETPIQIY